ncbi:uncharacterized protein EI97DRAFT_248020 [Westerdykella ornata]|uniref:Extracellular membrane protein CFEM domain-containing protein n=1 Tax=Westerdykella ornata TaxID=318751 RepID=A0A6A6JP74_WESOR|nr:uncharacterized protein EI97DRAFT_248020 [Westerdykella ornata]KAF2278197.1 hypothetical protein EI97DRAFT_248020 [Westerdykella ornata]
MHLSSILLAGAALLAGADACKCVSGGNVYLDASHACCNDLRGNWRNGNDCQAGSISEHLSNFRRCCRNWGLTSDCDCPTCSAAELQADAVHDSPVANPGNEK